MRKGINLIHNVAVVRSFSVAGHGVGTIPNVVKNVFKFLDCFSIKKDFYIRHELPPQLQNLLPLLLRVLSGGFFTLGGGE